MTVSEPQPRTLRPKNGLLARGIHETHPELMGFLLDREEKKLELQPKEPMEMSRVSALMGFE